MFHIHNTTTNKNSSKSYLLRLCLLHQSLHQLSLVYSTVRYCQSPLFWLCLSVLSQQTNYLAWHGNSRHRHTQCQIVRILSPSKFDCLRQDKIRQKKKKNTPEWQSQEERIQRNFLVSQLAR